jgi:hypothetical protein
MGSVKIFATCNDLPSTKKIVSKNFGGAPFSRRVTIIPILNPIREKIENFSIASSPEERWQYIIGSIGLRYYLGTKRPVSFKSMMYLIGLKRMVGSRAAIEFVDCVKAVPSSSVPNMILTIREIGSFFGVTDDYMLERWRSIVGITINFDRDEMWYVENMGIDFVMLEVVKSCHPEHFEVDVETCYLACNNFISRDLRPDDPDLIRSHVRMIEAELMKYDTLIEKLL